MINLVDEQVLESSRESGELDRKIWCWPEGNQQVAEGKPHIPEWSNRVITRVDL